MTAAIRHDHRVAQIFKSISTSILALLPSLLVGVYLLNNRLALQSAYLISCLILLLAAIDLVTVVLLEPYRRYLSKLVLPALICAMAVVLLFVIAEAFNRFFDHLGYNFLTPFVLACIALLYATVFLEKNIAMKCGLSLNSIAVISLWAMGSIDKIAMPF